MTVVLLLVAATIFLAYSNGANDNFKGVATLYGSGVAGYRGAIAWATAATFAGSICSFFAAAALLEVFSGKGVVPDAVAVSPIFLTAVAVGAATTVILATLTGFPISTTHSLTGAIIGCGLVAAGTDINFRVLGSSFFAPLLVSPILAICLTAPLYRAMSSLTVRLAITKETCVCVGAARLIPAQALPLSPTLQQYTISAGPDIGAPVVLVSEEGCAPIQQGQLFAASMKKLLDHAHYGSAAAVSFARGLNDTPKIVALLLIVQAIDVRLDVVVVAAAIAAGGLLNAGRVAQTMSKKICAMDDGEALTANLVTASLVIFASRLGLPVSTTHVSVGAITGIGVVNGTAHMRVVSNILASWLLTLPVAAALSAMTYSVLYHGI